MEPTIVLMAATVGLGAGSVALSVRLFLTLTSIDNILNVLEDQIEGLPKV